VYQAGRDLSADHSRQNINSGYQFGSDNMIGSHNNFGQQHVAIGRQHIGDRYELDIDPAGPLFTGRGPGRVLMALGLCVIAFCFAGWMSIVFGGITHGPMPDGEELGRPLGSGIPVGVVYFLGFLFGGLLSVIGRSMAKAAARRANPVGHLITTAVISGVGLIAVLYALGGSPPSALVPSFAGSSGASKPAVVVSDSVKSGTLGGVRLTVLKIENVNGRGVVHLQARNGTDSTVSLPTGWFLLTDGNGYTYQPALAADDWNDDLGAAQQQTGTITLEKPIPLGTGALRVEFTTVMGRGVTGGIRVVGIRSR
jgi:hypothetical protein